MSKLYRNLLIVLAVSPFITLAGLDGVTCVDCKNATARDCKVKTRGYMCFPKKSNKDSWIERTYANFSDDPAETDDLGVCIPDGLEIKTIVNYCCVWSPKTGCQLLRGPRVHKTAMECVRCILRDLDREDDASCPCLDVASKMCVHALLLVVAVLLVM